VLTLLSALFLTGAMRPGSSGPSFVNGTIHEGEEVTCDLPAADHIRNIGSSVDGKGMCVTSSLEMAARWQGGDEWRGLRDWCAREPGGAWPEKVDRQLKAFARAQGLPAPRYLQYRGRDPRPFLEAIDRTGRMACVTYGYSPRYGGTIAHMVCCLKFRGKWAVVLDNNFPGDQAYEWMPLNEMLRRISYPSGTAWVFVWLMPPPPPVPHNI
jgi:hypothetical protein